MNASTFLRQRLIATAVVLATAALPALAGNRLVVPVQGFQGTSGPYLPVTPGDGETGQPGAPAAAFTPGGELNLGSTPVGVATPYVPVTLKNVGTAPMVITGVSIVVNGPDFAQRNDCSGPLAVNAQCVINVHMVPQTAGHRTGVLGVTFEGGSGFVHLYGTARQAAAELTADTSASFGDVNVGSAASRTFTLASTGNVELTGIAASVSGADLSISDTTCGSTLTAGQNCSVTVRFAPSTTNSLSDAKLSIASSAPNSPAEVSLTGTGRQAVGALTADTSADFGAVPMGGTVNRVFTFSVTGNLAAQNVVPSVNNAALSIANSTCGSAQAPATVQAGANCSVTVAYTPTTTTALSGATLTVASTAANAPSVLTLSGTGTEVFINATGGTVTDVGDYRIHRFNASGSFQVIQAAPGANVTVALVGGGGGGGYDGGGGGGGGQVLVNNSYTVAVGSITVTVGSGGAPGAAAAGAAGLGATGGASQFGALTATGGGGGGYLKATGGTGANGGGAGNGYASAGAIPGGAATAGYAGGGAIASNYGGGGGGGAGGVGQLGTGDFGGAGGAGTVVSLAGGGLNLTVGCGGAGGTHRNPKAQASGGSGGACGGTGAGGALKSTAGLANTGGGGGGGGNVGGGAGLGSSGGSGVVIVTYRFR